MDTTEELNGTYFYAGHSRLKAYELFNLILLEQVAEHTGLEISAAAAVLAGQPYLETRTKPAGTVTGTSIASVTLRKLLGDIRLPANIRIPTPVGRNINDLRMARSGDIAVILGRYIPFMGWATAVQLSFSIARGTRLKYNTIARPEHRIMWTSW